MHIEIVELPSPQLTWVLIQQVCAQTLIFLITFKENIKSLVIMGSPGLFSLLLRSWPWESQRVRAAVAAGLAGRGWCPGAGLGDKRGLGEGSWLHAHTWRKVESTVWSEAA